MADEIVRNLSGGDRKLVANCEINFGSTATLAQSAGVVLDFPGARMGDVVRVHKVDAPPAYGQNFVGYVNATDKVTVYFNNGTATNPLDLAATRFWVIVEGMEPVGGPL